MGSDREFLEFRKAPCRRPRVERDSSGEDTAISKLLHPARAACAARWRPPPTPIPGDGSRTPAVLHVAAPSRQQTIVSEAFGVWRQAGYHCFRIGPTAPAACARRKALVAGVVAADAVGDTAAVISDAPSRRARAAAKYRTGRAAQPVADRGSTCWSQLRPGRGLADRQQFDEAGSSSQRRRTQARPQIADHAAADAGGPMTRNTQNSRRAMAADQAQAHSWACGRLPLSR